MRDVGPLIQTWHQLRHQFLWTFLQPEPLTAALTVFGCPGWAPAVTYRVQVCSQSIHSFTAQACLRSR